MRQNARKPASRRPRPTWVRPPVDAGAVENEAPTEAPAAPVARRTLASVGAAREEAERRVGAAPRRNPDSRIESRQSGRTARVGTARTGPSLLDQATAGLGYIRADLARIGILAGVMVAAIAALSLVLA